jgi:hypothetical protein
MAFLEILYYCIKNIGHGIDMVAIAVVSSNKQHNHNATCGIIPFQRLHGAVHIDDDMCFSLSFFLATIDGGVRDYGVGWCEFNKKGNRQQGDHV